MQVEESRLFYIFIGWEAAKSNFQIKWLKTPAAAHIHIYTKKLIEIWQNLTKA